MNILLEMGKNGTFRPLDVEQFQISFGLLFQAFLTFQIVQTLI